MATYYSVKNDDLNLGTINNSFGLSLSSLEVINSNTTDSLLLTSFQISPTLIVNQSNAAPAYVALNTSNRNSSPSGTLDLTVTDTVNNLTFIDNSPNKFLLNRTGNPINSVLTPYYPNGWSGYFNGTSTFLRANSAISFTGDFTIELFAYFNALVSNRVLCESWAGSVGWQLYWRSTGSSLTFFINSSTIVLQDSSSSSIEVGKWHHIALTRSSGTVTLFVDGIQKISASNSTNITGGAPLNIGSQSSNSTNYHNGYISNLRIIRNQAVYTTNFTPPTASFGLTDNGGAVGATSTPILSNVAILTLQDNRFKDNSTYNLALNSTASPTINQINPFTPKIYSPSIHGGSIFFDGTNSYFSTNVSNTLNLSGNFTMEVWIYKTTSSNFTIIDTRVTFGSHENYAFSINASNQIDFINTNAGSRYTTTESISVGTWNHVALVRNNNIIRGYINGVACSNTSNNSNVFNTANSIPLIFNTLGGSLNGNGYVSNFRIVKNQALYTTNFIPPTAILGLTDNGGALSATATPILSNVAILINNNNNNGATTSTSQSYPISSFSTSNSWNLLKLPNALSANPNERLNVSVKTSQPNQLSVRSNFSGLTALDDTRNNSVSSISNNITLSSVTIGGVATNAFYLSGTTGNNWLFAPASPLFNLNGDFTIELWFNSSAGVALDGGTVSRRLISFGPDGTNSLQFIFWDGSAATSNIGVYANNNLITGTRSVVDGNWHHVAVTRYAGSLKLFVDGLQSGSTNTNNTTFFNAGTASGLSIGTRNNASTGRVQGYIANLRIIKDLAVYTNPFTVPSIQSVSATPETVFLLKDGIINNFNRMLINEPTNNNNYFNSTGFFNSVDMRASLGSISRINTDTRWTIEGYVYMTDLSVATQTFIAINGGDILGISLNRTANTGLTQVFLGNGTWYAVPTIQATVPLSVNRWHHIALVRNGNNTSYYENGLLVGTHSNAPSGAAATELIIGTGRGGGSSEYFRGYMSNIRITMGQALYTTNFTPATNFLGLTHNGNAVSATETPILSNVTLLALQSNGIPLNYSIYNNTITNNGVLISNEYSDIHIGGLLSGTNIEKRDITADSFTVSSINMNNNGTLSFPYTPYNTLNVIGSAGLNINFGGTLNIGTSSSVVPLSTTQIINLSNTQIDVNDGGTFNVYGFPETTTTSLVSTHPIGSRIFTVTNTVSNNWRVGDVLAFKPNLSARTSFDVLTLSSFVSPNVFTTTSSSLCTHTGSADQFGFIPDVYNLSRNVIIRGFNSTARGSIRTFNSAKTNVNYAQLSNFGINFLNKTGFILGNNASGNTILSGIVINSDNTSTVNNIAPLTGQIFQNVIISNSIINRSNIIVLSSLSSNNISISNNYILSSGNIGIQISNLSGSINIVNNTTIGSLNYGTYLFNNSLNGAYGALNYNSGLQGMMVSGSNTGTINGGSINSPREGVYVDASTSNLNGLTFQNILVNNNSNLGFKVSGNNLNYTTPVILNINGLTANNNRGGIEAYNICGYLSNIKINDISLYTLSGSNLSSVNNFKTSLGNANLVLDNLNLTDNQFNFGSFNGTSSYLYLSSISGSNTDISLGDFTIEAWFYWPSILGGTRYGLLSRNEPVADARGLVIGIESSPNVIGSFISMNGSTWNNLLYSSVLPLANTWYHIALTRNSTGFVLWINGVNSASSPALSTNRIYNVNQQWRVGASTGGGANTFHNGFIKDFRVVKGQALYTTDFIPPSANLTLISNGGATPSVAPLSSNVSILSLQDSILKDNSTNNYLLSNVSGIRFISNNNNIHILSGINYNETSILNSNINNLILSSSRLETLILNNSNINLINSISSTISMGGYISLNNTIIGNGISSLSTISNNIAVMNENRISNNHYKITPEGIISYDATIFIDSNGVSEKLEPTSNIYKLRSSSKYIPVNLGSTTTVTVYVRKSTNYTGAAPRLMLKRNASLGYENTVLATSVVANGVWNALTASIPAALNSGVFEVYVDCSGNAGSGSINIDNWDFN